MKKFIPLAFALVVFSACSSSGDQTAETTINADTVLDDQLFSQATSQNNLEKCNQISDQARKDECVVVVEGLIITEEAVKTLDNSLCEDIKDERYKENCESSVEETIATNEALAKAEEEAAKKESERLSTESEALSKGDADICNDIEDENQKYSCRYNVLVSQATQNNDPSRCDEIGEDNYVKECKLNSTIRQD